MRKLGNTEWNPGTIAGVIANERHCGDVLARKTFTPNFLTHKSKKNNNDRTQYRQRDHHEAIVSREVYNAANHLRASRNYTRKNRPLPVLSVVDDGILRGYVPFDKDWTGFSAEEYREASESVMREKQPNTVEVMNRLDLTGYEVVRAQYFATLQNPALTISNGRLRFNAACLKKFDDVEYVELLLNSVDRCIAIRPCEKSNPNAIRWGRLKEGRWCASTLGCRGLAKALFDIMEWDEDLKYRFRGQLVEQNNDKLMLFELDEPEMIKVEEIVLRSLATGCCSNRSFKHLLSMSLSFKSTFASAARIFAACSRSMFISASYAPSIMLSQRFPISASILCSSSNCFKNASLIISQTSL